MKVELKDWRIGDAECIVKYANNKKVADNLRDGFPYPYTYDDAKSFISGIIDKGKSKQCLLAILVDGEVCGSIGVFMQDNVYSKSAEIGYWLGEPFWGKGIMTKAIKKMCEIAFANYDIVRIYAEAFAYNTASRRALEKAGFVLEGIKKNSVYKNGKMHDSFMHALVKLDIN